MTPNEYRQKHPKCATCEYLEEKEISGTHITNHICAVKNLYVEINKKTKCKVYKAKEFKENA